MRRLSLSRAVIICCAIGLMPLTAARAQDDVVSNLDVLTGLSTRVVYELVDQFEDRIRARGVLLKPAQGGEDYIFVTNVFAGVLSEKGVKTYMPGAGSVSAAEVTPFTLEFQTMEFSLRYTNIRRRYLIGGRRVSREADVTILAKLIEPSDGSIMWIGEASHNHDDKFSYGDVAEVEDGTFDFIKPERPTSSLTRFAEPILVSGIIVGLIYLFFSNQSDN